MVIEVLIVLASRHAKQGFVRPGGRQQVSHLAASPDARIRRTTVRKTGDLFNPGEKSVERRLIVNQPAFPEFL